MVLERIAVPQTFRPVRSTRGHLDGIEAANAHVTGSNANVIMGREIASLLLQYERTPPYRDDPCTTSTSKRGALQIVAPCDSNGKPILMLD
jgi:hypothetical protein